MTEKSPVTLCEGCPLRELLPNTGEVPEPDRYLTKVNEQAVGRSWIENDGSAAHFEIDFAHGPKQAEVAILSEGVDSGPAFWVEKRTWESGRVGQAFEQCEEPEVVKSGFLKMRKRVECPALKSLK